jgi:hypothetical protein
MIAQQFKKIVRITAGCIALLFGISWIYEWGSLWYDYHFTNKLFIVMLPDYFLIAESILGLLLVGMSYYIFKEKVRIRVGVIAILVTYLLSYFIVQRMLVDITG